MASLTLSKDIKICLPTLLHLTYDNHEILHQWNYMHEKQNLLDKINAYQNKAKQLCQGFHIFMFDFDLKMAMYGKIFFNWLLNTDFQQM